MNKKILVFIPLAAIALSSCVGTKHYDSSEYMIDVEWKNEDFKILQLSDIHFSNSDYYPDHFKVIQKTIDQANPDLIVLNGDAFTFASKTTVRILFDFIDEQEIPWTFAYGNHDDQGYFSDTYIQRLLAGETYKNVKFVNPEDDDVTGRSNFVLNIKKSDILKYQVYIFDSHSYDFDTMYYDYIKEDQIDWYKRMVEDTNKAINPSWQVGNDAIKSSAFFHIPLVEFREALEKINAGEVNPELGGTEEICSAPHENTGLFKAFKDYKSTQTVSCGHDHVNDFVITWDGIKLCYGVHATNRIYYSEEKIGGQIITIDGDDTSNTTVENIYVSYDSVKEAK